MPLTIGNTLLGALSAADRAAVLVQSQAFDFRTGHVFCEAGDWPTHVTFPDSGVISTVALMADGRSVEVMMIGQEGATHPLAMDAASCCYARLVAQSTGSAHRIEIARLRALADERPAIRDALTAYAARLISELEQSVACNALHRADQRFAKWLLRCHDRVDGDTMNLTQEYLASMLGSQRTTVNEAAQQLQRQGAIRYSRGRILVQDRAALAKAACECYGHHAHVLDQPVAYPRLRDAESTG
ncbi:MAG: Crp/Fnr family transcriptional regulator [Brevundimonas sp.]|nr:MAG: Crp/Fnr family transcriptional regulator [Brevundimonas sp.]